MTKAKKQLKNGESSATLTVLLIEHDLLLKSTISDVLV